MTDIRSRHVRSNSRPNYCAQDGDWWGENGCDAAIALAMLDKAEAALADLNAVTIEWWVCAWCDARFPYTDGPDTLKAHSTVCPSHPGNIRADKAEATLRGATDALLYERDKVADMLAQRDAARGDAERLAEALGPFVSFAIRTGRSNEAIVREADAALTAHKEATSDGA
jgi:hypothetical protein